MLDFFTIAAFATSAIAIPTNAQQCPWIPQLANFDDLQGTSGLPINGVPNGYKGIRYQGVDFTATVQLDDLLDMLPLTLPGLELPGLLPHSGLNYARIGLTSKLGGTPTLTTNYKESNTESFRLESFYYGCALQGTGLFALPTECMVNFTGYTGNDDTISSSSQVCSQTYTYNPSTQLGLQEQTFGKFDDCKGKDLQFATITAVLPGGQAVLDPALVLLVDDLRFSTKAKKC